MFVIYVGFWDCFSDTHCKPSKLQVKIILEMKKSVLFQCEEETDVVMLLQQKYPV